MGWRWGERFSSRLGGALRSTGSALLEAGEAIIDAGLAFIDDPIGAAKNAYDATVNAVETVGDYSWQGISTAYNYVLDHRGDVWDGVKQFGSDLLTTPPHRSLIIMPGQGLLRAGAVTFGMVGDLGRWTARSFVNLGNDAYEIPLTIVNDNGDVGFVRDENGEIVTQRLHLATNTDGHIIDQNGNILNRSDNVFTFNDDGSINLGTDSHIMALDEDRNFIAVNKDGRVDNSIEVQTGWNPPAQADGRREYVGMASGWANAVTFVKPRNNVERVILYGAQAVVEVGTFVVLSAATAGAGGAAFATARLGGAAIRGSQLAARSISLARSGASIVRSTSVGGRMIATTARAGNAASTHLPTLTRAFNATSRGIGHVSGRLGHAVTQPISTKEAFNLVGRSARAGARFVNPVKPGREVVEHLTERSVSVGQKFMGITRGGGFTATKGRTTITFQGVAQAPASTGKGQALRNLRSMGLKSKSARLAARAERIQERVDQDRRAFRWFGPRGHVLTRGEAIIETAGALMVVAPGMMEEIMAERMRREIIDGYIDLLESNDRFLNRDEDRESLRQHLYNNPDITEITDSEKSKEVKIKDYLQDEFGIDINDEQGRNYILQGNITGEARERLINQIVAFLNLHQTEGEPIEAQTILQNNTVTNADSLYEYFEEEYGIVLEDYDISRRAFRSLESRLIAYARNDKIRREQENAGEISATQAALDVPNIMDVNYEFIQQNVHKRLVAGVVVFLNENHGHSLDPQVLLANDNIQTPAELYTHLIEQYDIDIADYGIPLEALEGLSETYLQEAEEQFGPYVEDEQSQGSNGSGDNRAPVTMGEDFQNAGTHNRTQPTATHMAYGEDDGRDEEYGHGQNTESASIRPTFTTQAQRQTQSDHVGPTRTHVGRTNLLVSTMQNQQSQAITQMLLGINMPRNTASPPRVNA